jgi:hypothetical protein
MNKTNGGSERSRSESENNNVSKLHGNAHKQRIIKIHEEMLLKITRNGNIVSPETERFFSQKIMKKDLYDIHIYRTKE